MKQLLIVLLTIMSVSLLASSVVLATDDNLGEQLAGSRWTDEIAHIQWWRIDVSGKNVEIFMVEYCPEADCSQQKRSSNRKDFYGKIEGYKLVGFYLQFIEINWEQGGKSCSSPKGYFPRRGIITDNGHKIEWGLIEAPTYGGCPPLPSHATWTRE